MIKYTLSCASGCHFEAWFQNSRACDEQLAAGQVSCPICGGGDLSKALMAPNISAAAPQEAPPEDGPRANAPSEAAPPGPAAHAAPAAAHKRAVEEALWALRAHIERTADNVGSKFAAEARRMHEGEVEERPIYGDATPDEVQDLLEDGVPVATAPWINRRDD